MFDFDVLRISEVEEPRADDVLTLGTVHLGAHVVDVPRGPALMLPPELTPASALETLRRNKRATAVVVQHQRPLGILTDRDLFARARLGGTGLQLEPRDNSIASLMIPVSPLRATDTVGGALRLMCALHQWHLPIVCARGLMLGSVDIADLSMWMRDRMTLLSVDAALGTSWAQTG
jgi:CBS domain-containing protein